MGTDLRELGFQLAVYIIFDALRKNKQTNNQGLNPTVCQSCICVSFGVDLFLFL